MFKKLKPKSEFSRNVLTLMTGTTIAQAIPIAISPILTRIYTPEDFGIFALYMSIASLISVIATGRYELSIMLPKKDEDAINIVTLSILIAIAISFITLLVIFFLNDQITRLLGNPEISSWLYVIPLSVLLTGIYQSFNYWSNRKKEYKRLAASRIIQSATTATNNLGMGYSGFGSGGLILGNVLGQGVATYILVKLVWKEDKKLVKSIRKLKIFALIKKFKKFPILNVPNAFIDAIRVSGINILIAKLFTVSTLGQFSLAWKMVQTPLSMIGSSLSQVFFQKVSSTKKSNLHTLVKIYIIKATLISLPIFIGIYIFAIDIFTVIFGADWKLAGEAASTMTPWLFLNFLSTPMSNIFIVLNKQEIVLLVAVFYMILPLSILWILQELSFIYVLQVITLVMCCILLIYIGLVFIYTKKEEKYGL